MATRNLAAEKNAIGVFAKTKGRLPEKGNTADWADVHKMAYPTINDLPDEFKATEAASYYSGTGGKPAAPATTPTPGSLPQSDANLGGLAGNVDSARANLDQLSTPNSALNILQEAIKAKTQTAAAPIGESKIFEQAGVGGYGALSQSLAARGTELNINATDFKNIVGQMAGTYKDMATTALSRYEAAKDEYDRETSRIQKIQDDLRDNEQAIFLADKAHKAQMDLERFRQSNPSFSEQIGALDKGYEINGNTVTDPSKGIVAGFNIGRYATDPNHERAVASIVQNIGQFQTLNDVDAYIKRKYPNSPVTSEMISKSSEKYNVPWEILVAMMEQDSSLGTAGKGARTFNPGNVGNDDAGNIRNYGSWDKGVDAVANWLSKNRAPAPSSNGSKFTPQFYSTSEGQKVRDDERAMQSMFLANQNVKDFQAVQGQYQGMQKVLSSGVGGPGDLDLVYSFMKGLDPNSVVRETEFATAAKSGNIFSGVFSKYNGYLKDNGGFLPDKVKNSFVELVKNKMEVKKAGADKLRKDFQEQAARQGLNPENVTIDFTLPDVEGSTEKKGGGGGIDLSQFER